MKHIFIIFLFTIFISGYSLGVSAIDYNVSYEKNTDLNIKGAKLIEKYIYSLLNNLDKIQKKYSLNKNKKIEEYTKTLKSMTILLSKIENSNISKKKAEEIMRIIINKLKPINNNIKKLLKKEKINQEQKKDKLKQKYYNLSLKLSQTLDNIIIKFYIPIKNKLNLTNNEKTLLNTLRNLKKNSDSLKNIESLNLKEIKDIKSKLLNILREIRSNLYLLKNI